MITVLHLSAPHEPSALDPRVPATGLPSQLVRRQP